MLKSKLLNLKEKLKNPKLQVGAITVSTALLASGSLVHADGLDPAITAGFTTAGTNAGLIIGAGVAAAVGVIALSGGAKAGLKWIKGVFAKAS